MWISLFDEGIMEHLKSILTSLLGNCMDRVNIIHHLNIFDDNVNDESSFLSLKLRLQLQVLRSIMKEDKSEYYSRLMNETESLLIFPGAYIVPEFPPP